MTVENRENFGDDPKFFIGVEVERSPLFGMTTLFVVGQQNPKEILQRMLDNGIEHVYLGCGYTFNPETPEDWKDWRLSLVRFRIDFVWHVGFSKGRYGQWKTCGHSRLRF